MCLCVAQVHVPELDAAAARTVLAKEYPACSGASLDACCGFLDRPIALKQLLMIAEMSRADDTQLDPDRFFECVHTVLAV